MILEKITFDLVITMGDKTKTADSPFLTVKVAGGATAQCIGLMNAIYLRNKIGKQFKIKYFPYST